MANSRDTYQFTAAASRALAAAARWTTSNGEDLLSPPQLLLGLLAEIESRAAEMLAARGIDVPAVLARWPQLIPSAVGEEAQSELSSELRDALATAAYHLHDFARPPELATEHLLLGLVASHNELADWLVQRGFTAEALAGEIRRLYCGSSNGDSAIDEIPPLADDSVGYALRGVPSADDGSNNVDRTRGTMSALNLAVAGTEPRHVPDFADGVQCGDAPVAPPPGHRWPETSSTTANLARPASAPASSLPDRNDIRPAQTALLRLIDAAANRAREGLRVVEDFVRFVWDDRHLMANLKHLRHDLSVALAPVAIDDLLASRDTLADVGTTLSTATEGDRPDLASVVTANFKRLQESLRSLEEYGKVLDPALALQIEQLRYRTYTMERAVATTSFGLQSLAGAQLYVLLDGRHDLGEFTRVARSLIAAGVDVVQLRDKQLSDRELLARAHRLRDLTRQTSTLFIMNDRPDLARLSYADGVHVGQDELSVQACRSVVGPRALIGVSTHSLDQARRAVLDGANYIGVGPTFVSRTKRFAANALGGVELLRSVHREVCLPAFAIGGIDHLNLAQVLATGFTRIAVSGAILSSDDPAHAVHEMLIQVKRSSIVT